MKLATQDQDTVCFIGDSITHNGLYHKIIADVCTLRWPERRVRWVNAGISGDSAGGALARFDSDIASHRPTQAFVLFGMNDGNRGLYTRSAAATADNAAARARAIQAHADNTAALLSRLMRLGTREVCVLSPTAYDQYSSLDGTEEPCGYDDALAGMGANARVLAEQTGATFIDLHGPFLAALRAELAPGQRTAFIRDDRVHPVPAGHLLMAAIILESLGVKAGVGRTEIGVDGSVADDATIHGWLACGGRMAWSCLARSLPCGAPAEAWAGAPEALKARWRRLNCDLLCIRGLAPGRHALSIDGHRVVTAEAGAWAAGVDLAAIPEAPQAAQAAEVSRLSDVRHAFIVTRVRNPTAARMFLGWDRYALRQRGIAISDDDTVAAQQLVAAGEGNPYVIGLYRDMLAYGSAEALAEAAASITGMDEAIHAAARIPERRYTIERIS